MGAFVIPTIFSAVDKFSGPVFSMSKNLGTFSDKAEVAVVRSERLFRKLTPALSTASKEMFSFASSAAVAGAAVAGAYFSVDSLKKYEDGLASFRTIVSDLTNNEFSKYQDKISEVAFDTKKSTVEVVSAFESIAGLNAKFAESADSIGAVSKAAITLAKASRMELQPSAENLVSIMNQFSLGAQEADRTINVLAAGQAVGAASIGQTAEAFKNFGSVASNANLSLEESVGLIQTVGKYSLFGAEAGTKLRGSILRLQAANIGYASGQFNVNDALTEARNKIEKLTSAKEKDAALDKIFGAENISTGRILLNNIATFKEYTAGVTGTSEAQIAAQINSKTLSNRLAELSAKWVNIITTSDKVGSSLLVTNAAVEFVTNNMETLVLVGSTVLALFSAWKVGIVVSKIALVAYNVVLGINAALTGASAFAVMGNTVAHGAFRASIVATTSAQAALNYVMAINPYVAAAVAVGVLITAISLLLVKYESLEEHQNKALKANKITGFQNEKNAILETAAAYEKYGKSKADAQKLAIADAQKALEADRAGAYYKIASAKTEDETRIAERVMASVEGRANALQNTDAIFKENDTQKEAANFEAAKQQSMQRSFQETITRQKATLDINNNTDKPMNLRGGGESIKLTSTWGQ